MTADFPLPPRFRVLEVLQTDDVQVRLRVADETLQREVVLELPGAARLLELDQGNQRVCLLREARSLAKVHHPCVQRILDVIEHAGVPMLLLEPRHGRTLEDLLRERGRLESHEVQRIGIQVAEAAQAVHAAGVVHRDLREANILVAADGSCVLTGFSFAKPQGSPFHRSSINYGRQNKEPGARLLPMYPAPEQMRGAAADARTDVYGLGCVLAHCLTGTAPKPEEAITAAMLAQQAPQARRRLVEVIAGCLAPAPSGRFPTMQAVAAALQQVGTPAKAISRRALLATAAAVGVIAPLGWVLARGSDAPESPRGPFPGRNPGAEEQLDRDWYGKGHAVVIGIDYDGAPGEHPRLFKAESDAKAIAESLRKLGWQHVHQLIGGEATCVGISNAIAKVQRSEPQDQVFVYFAGHGIPHPETPDSGWLLPWDAARQPKGETYSDQPNWISMTRVMGWLKREIPARHILIALDSCYSGAAVPSAATRGEETVGRNNVRQLLNGVCRKVISSAPRAARDDSPFCKVFLECLELTDDRCVIANDIFAKLQRRLLEDTDGVQPPSQGASAESNPLSDFVFGRYLKGR